MRVRVINRRHDAMAMPSSHDNIFADVSSLAAPRGIPAAINLAESAQVLRPEAFALAANKRVTKASPHQVRGVACFQAQAVIITQQGAKPVSSLTTEDFVLTLDNGYQSVKWVGELIANPASPMTVEISPDAILDGKPDKKIRVSGRQSILLTCPEIQSQFGSAEVLARAGDLLHLPGFSSVECTDNKVAILLAQHELVNVNGLWMDSLMPDSEALDSLPKADRLAVKAQVPDLGSLPIDRSYPSARTLLRAEFTRQFTR